MGASSSKEEQGTTGVGSWVETLELQSERLTEVGQCCQEGQRRGTWQNNLHWAESQAPSAQNARSERGAVKFAGHHSSTASLPSPIRVKRDAGRETGGSDAARTFSNLEPPKQGGAQMTMVQLQVENEKLSRKISERVQEGYPRHGDIEKRASSAATAEVQQYWASDSKEEIAYQSESVSARETVTSDGEVWKFNWETNAWTRVYYCIVGNVGSLKIFASKTQRKQGRPSIQEFYLPRTKIFVPDVWPGHAEQEHSAPFNLFDEEQGVRAELAFDLEADREEMLTRLQAASQGQSKRRADKKIDGYFGDEAPRVRFGR